ncbi:unnamed protein product [Mytilus edulis]|uniref:Uncharacterized protein n=1 Tax=Mytilus edulis TaxID=6550 RepID=A0A8S3QGS7_MYTED|nr:unnamed protein product [Mytilus edulis]
MPVTRNKARKNYKLLSEFGFDQDVLDVSDPTSDIFDHETSPDEVDRLEHRIHNLALSPLNSVPKKDSTERRVIVDLSFPEGEAVNSGIFKDRYLGDEISVSYPTVDDFIMLIKSKGQGCRMFKRDLKRAYRQLVVDPGDIHLLGYKWRGHLYYDRVLTMGLRSAAYICMRTTNAIAFICQNMGIDILNYLDDLAGCDIPSSSDDAYAKLGLILQNCGIEESIEKACPPSTKMMFIGILFDSENMTISIDTQRLSEILQLVSNWLCSTNCTKRENYNHCWEN